MTYLLRHGAIATTRRWRCLDWIAAHAPPPAVLVGAAAPHGMHGAQKPPYTAARASPQHIPPPKATQVAKATQRAHSSR